MKQFLRVGLLMFIFSACKSGGSIAKEPQETGLPNFKEQLSSAVTKHLELLLDTNGKLLPLKGKATDATTAMAFYRMYEMNGNKKYREAGVTLADKILKEMKQTKFGVLYIKEKGNNTGKKLAGGGPPALGWYTATLAYIYNKEGNRESDLSYIATVLDSYPYNDKGWWASTIDISTGGTKNGLSKPSPVNKNAALAMATGMVSGFMKNINPALADRLKKKADQCLYGQIIPAQQQDGFWHYGLTGNDPNDKDVLGYFMVTMDGLMQLYQSNETYRSDALKVALAKAATFAYKTIAPITEPNTEMAMNRYTPGTPSQYRISGDIKRGYSLGAILLEGGFTNEAVKIIGAWSPNFPYGNTGSDGAHALHSSIMMLTTIEKGIKN